MRRSTRIVLTQICSQSSCGLGLRGRFERAPGRDAPAVGRPAGETVRPRPQDGSSTTRRRPDKTVLSRARVGHPAGSCGRSAGSAPRSVGGRQRAMTVRVTAARAGWRAPDRAPEHMNGTRAHDRQRQHRNDAEPPMSVTPSSPLAPPPVRRGDTDSGHRHLGLALLVIATAQLMIILDGAIVNIALPTIQRGLHFSSANLAWVVNGYTLAFGGLLLLGGRA